MLNKALKILLMTVFSVSCDSHEKTKFKTFQKVGEIQRLDKQLDEVISPNAVIEVLSTGHKWSEGPIWYLIWSYN
jgi:gluconolactonase